MSGVVVILIRSYFTHTHLLAHLLLVAAAAVPAAVG